MNADKTVAKEAPAVPDILFDGKAVYDEVLQRSSGTTASNVADTLDAIARLIRRGASVAKEATRDAADLRTFLLNHITSHEIEGRSYDRLTLAHNEVHLLREMMGEAATRDAEQPIIGKLLNQMTQLQMLFPDGCQEPGALVRFSEVTKVLVNASKQQANVLPPFAAPAGQRDAVVAQLASALRSANLLLAETFISTGKDVGERASKVSYQIEMALATASDDALASGFREGRNTKPESTESGLDIATTTSTVSAPTDAQKGSSHE